MRRLMLYIEVSIERGARWAHFEPNDEQLCAAVLMSDRAAVRYAAK